MKRQKHQDPKPMLSKRYLMKDLDARPVTDKDTWCYRPAFRHGIPLKEGNWGYIISIPFNSKKSLNLSDFKGYSIIRTKKQSDKMLLQIVWTPFCNKNYYIISKNAKKKKSKTPHFLNVQNWTP